MSCGRKVKNSDMAKDNKNRKAVYQILPLVSKRIFPTDVISRNCNQLQNVQ